MLSFFRTRARSQYVPDGTYKTTAPNKREHPEYSKNDTDDYTQVVAYVNKEFARIQEEEQDRAGNRQEITQENLSIEERIIRILIEKPDANRKDLAQLLGITSDSVNYRLDKLKESGRIEHQGSTKAGKWVVLE